MKKIKFKVWNKRLKRFDFVTDTKYLGGRGFYDQLVDNENSLWCLFSGLGDSTGKDIYEGDIVLLADYGDYEVEFPFLQLYDSAAEGDVGKIIGNIYENPELLKTEEKRESYSNPT